MLEKLIKSIIALGILILGVSSAYNTYHKTIIRPQKIGKCIMNNLKINEVDLNSGDLKPHLEMAEIFCKYQ